MDYNYNKRDVLNDIRKQITSCYGISNKEFDDTALIDFFNEAYDDIIKEFIRYFVKKSMLTINIHRIFQKDL